MDKQYNDIAIVISWPDCLAKGDDRWYELLRDIGLFKNLHFKVGHAALILVEKPSGKLHYFDFGRYIAPRGYGRVRGGNTDPGLKFPFHAEISDGNTIVNLKEIIHKMQEYKEETHGYGKMFFSICTDINYEQCRDHIASMQAEDYIEYGAVAPYNTNCSRFVCDTIRAGYKETFNWRLKFPETIVPSTLGNVVNANSTEKVHFFFDGYMKKLEFDRWDAMRYTWSNIWENTSTKRTAHLPADHSLGDLKKEEKPENVPDSAQWIGGLGEGAWHFLTEKKETGELLLRRYKKDGKIDFTTVFKPIELFNILEPYNITWGTHAQKLKIKQNNKTFTSKRINKEQSSLNEIELTKPLKNYNYG